MKVINCSHTDWANFGYDNAMALRSVGVDAESLCMMKHKFNYKKASTIATAETIRRKMREADVVQIIHSYEDSLNCFIASKAKAKLIVYYSGSNYRNNPSGFNKLFNPLADKSVIALGEFAGLGCKNEHYLVGAVDTDSIVPNYVEPNYYTIGHYPSSAEIKGTEEIRKMVGCLKNDTAFIFNCSTKLVDYQAQLKRLSECDIYIELFNPSLNGKKYGSWGITALEAAAIGKVVVTQNLSNDVYEKNYGDCPFILVSGREDFMNKVDGLLRLPYEKLLTLQQETRQWAVEKHGYAATGKRIVETILI